MENNKKSLITTFLMVVGVVFVLTAGGIFMKQTWQYMPEVVKEMCLLLAGIGGLAGSVFVSKKQILKKTEVALFYMGDAFLGFFTVAFMSDAGVAALTDKENAQQIFAALVLMLIPVIVKTIMKSSILECIVAVGMVNLSMLVAITAFDGNFSSYLVQMSIFTGLLMVIARFAKDAGEDKIGKLVEVLFLVHEGITAFYFSLWGMSYMIESYVSTGVTEGLINGMVALSIIGICIVLSGLVWYDDKQAHKVFQLVVMICVFLLTLLTSLVTGELVIGITLGIVSLAIAIVSAIKNDKLYVVISGITLLIIAFYMTREFWLNINWWVYMLAAGVILIVLAVKKERESVKVASEA